MSRNRKTLRKNKHRRGKYSVTLHTAPRDLSATELAVLLAATTHLTKLSNLPGFDPASVHVQLTFPSGNVGCANLSRDASGRSVVRLDEGEPDVSSSEAEVQETEG